MNKNKLKKYNAINIFIIIAINTIKNHCDALKAWNKKKTTKKENNIQDHFILNYQIKSNWFKSNLIYLTILIILSSSVFCLIFLNSNQIRFKIVANWKLLPVFEDDNNDEHKINSAAYHTIGKHFSQSQPIDVVDHHNAFG